MAGDAGTLLKAAVSAGLVAGGHPGGLLGLSPDQLAAAAQAGGHLSGAAARAVTGKTSGEISADEYDLVTDPARELPRRAAAAVRAGAAGRPLVVFLDTGEVIGDRAWGWLRRVMAGTGPTVAWVVGARFETEAEAGADSPVTRFVRDIGDAHLMLMSPTRFDDAMIRSYLEGRLGGCGFSDEQVDLIARFTRGLPLAVSLTAALLGERQQPEDVCREVDDGHARQRRVPPCPPLPRPRRAGGIRRQTTRAGTTSRKSSAWPSPSATCAATRTCWPRSGTLRPR